MAIVNCKECGSKVSDTAKACPSCGAKPAQATSRLAILFAAVVLFAIFIAIGGGSGHSAKAAKQDADDALTPAQRAEDKAAAEVFDAHMARAQASIPALKATMKNPDSFKLDAAMLTATGALCFEYHGTNGFNAIVPAKAVVAPDSQQIATGSDRQVALLWNKHCAHTSGQELAAVLR